MADNDKGSFYVTKDALEAFVRKIVTAYPELTLDEITLHDSRNGLLLTLYIKARNGMDLLAVRNNLREKIYEEMQSKLGVSTQITSINFEAIDFVEPVEPDQPVK